VQSDKTMGGPWLKKKVQLHAILSSQKTVTRSNPRGVLLMTFYFLQKFWKVAFGLRTLYDLNNIWWPLWRGMRRTWGCCWGRGARRVTACHSHCLRTGPRPAYLSTCASAPPTPSALPVNHRPSIEIHWMQTHHFPLSIVTLCVSRVSLEIFNISSFF